MASPQSDELKDFLLSRQHRQPVNQIDWVERRQKWIDAVERLYHQITDELLADSIAQGLVTVSRNEKVIDEEYLGTYSLSELVLDVSGENVRLSPKGRNIVGANGRVDLIGELDVMSLILEPAGHWDIVLSRVPRHVVALDRKTLADALRRVMR